MNDTVMNIGSSTIQHGKYNDRIYLMKLLEEDFPGIIPKLDKLADERLYSKIFAKVPAYMKVEFEKHGYTVEAHVQQFFRGAEDSFFVSKFFSQQRAQDRSAEKAEEVLRKALNKEPDDSPIHILAPGFEYRLCQRTDAGEMAKVYKQVFETYPFPIHDPGYLEKTMSEDVVYFGVFKERSIAALSSAEMDIEAKNAEMTDFAVLPEYRGRRFSAFLLGAMEQEMRRRGIKTAYTIARALSHGMNMSFSRAGYVYGGTLVNNTNICGHFESMNVWYKFLQT